MSEAYKPKAKIHFEWECFDQGISSHEPEETSRAKVFGGWLVYAREFHEDGYRACTMVFVPDPNHEWEL